MLRVALVRIFYAYKAQALDSDGFSGAIFTRYWIIKWIYSTIITGHDQASTIRYKMMLIKICIPETTLPTCTCRSTSKPDDTIPPSHAKL